MSDMLGVGAFDAYQIGLYGREQTDAFPVQRLTAACPRSCPSMTKWPCALLRCDARNSLNGLLATAVMLRTMLKRASSGRFERMSFLTSLFSSIPESHLKRTLAGAFATIRFVQSGQLWQAEPNSSF